MKKKSVIFSLAVVGIVIVLGTIFIFSKDAGEVSLLNQASETIDQATVEVCNQKFNFYGIAPGERKTAKFRVGADSHYEVSVAFHSGRKIDARVGYVTSGVKYKDILVVTGNEVTLKTGPPV